MHAAIYIRKSRADKDKPSHRLTVQRETLPAYARSQGWTCELYDDGHASAARGKTDHLQERARLERDIRHGQVNIILVIELSRLSRDDTMQDFMAWMALCRDYGVKLATPSQIIDPSLTDHWVLSGITGILSSAEMQQMQKRMKEGMDQAYTAGKFLGGQPPMPYTYDKSLGKPIIDPVQLAKMQRLWSMAETMSARAVATEMALPEIFVRRAISDDRLEFYQARRPRPDGDGTIQCDWEPCMTAEQAQRIRAGRRNRTNLGGPRAAYAGLLSNLQRIYCGYCGKTAKVWQGKIRADGARIDYYGCQQKNGRTCTKSRMIPQYALNHLVADNLCNTLARINDLKRFWNIAKDGSDPARELRSLDRQDKQESEKKRRIVQAIAEGVITSADAREQIDSINNALADISLRRQDIIAKQKAPPNWDDLTITHAEFDSMPSDEQREIIALAIERIDIYNTYAIITYSFPRTAQGERSSRIYLPDRAPLGGHAPKHPKPKPLNNKKSR